MIFLQTLSFEEKYLVPVSVCNISNEGKNHLGLIYQEPIIIGIYFSHEEMKIPDQRYLLPWSKAQRTEKSFQVSTCSSHFMIEKIWSYILGKKTHTNCYLFLKNAFYWRQKYCISVTKYNTAGDRTFRQISSSWSIVLCICTNFFSLKQLWLQVFLPLFWQGYSRMEKFHCEEIVLSCQLAWLFD